jgi:epoxide hydrolase-like predicted phosphatase
MVKAVIFDCFGVIITDALHAVLNELDEDKPEARAEIMNLVHAANVGMMSVDDMTDQITTYLKITPAEWRSRLSEGEVRDEKVLAWIRSLRNEYKTALLSNVGRGGILQRFSEQELNALFDEVVVSGDVGVMKPDSQIYEMTAGRLGVIPEECVFIDDREGHLDGARRVGMQTILFENYAQAKADFARIAAK